MSPWAEPVLLRIGPVAIRWYGLLLALAILLATGALAALLRRQGHPRAWDEAVSLALAVGPLGLVGARLAFILQNFTLFLGDPGRMVAIWEGGLALHGALVGGLLALAWRERRSGRFLRRADELLTVLPLAQAVGRWGNLFNRELLGRPTQLPWGVLVEPAYRPAPFAASAAFHPVFLYESLACLALFALLWRRAVAAGAEGPKSRPGLQVAWYLLGYGAIRFVVEFLRIGEPVAWGLTLAQWVSLVMVAGGGALLGWARPAPRGSRLKPRP